MFSVFSFLFRIPGITARLLKSSSSSTGRVTLPALRSCSLRVAHLRFALLTSSPRVCLGSCELILNHYADCGFQGYGLEYASPKPQLRRYHQNQREKWCSLHRTRASGIEFETIFERLRITDCSADYGLQRIAVLKRIAGLRISLGCGIICLRPVCVSAYLPFAYLHLSGKGLCLYCVFLRESGHGVPSYARSGVC